MRYGNGTARGALERSDPGLAISEVPREGGSCLMVAPNPTPKPWRGTPYPNIRMAVYAKSDFKCTHCGWAPEIPDGYDGRYALYGHVPRRNGTLALWSLDLDHIHPYSAGGRFELTNLQALCTSCNNKKGAHV